MATPKTEREKIFEKYGVGTTSDKGKQSNSASPTRTNETTKTKTKREEIYEKYGVGGTPTKRNVVPTTTKVTSKKHIDYNTETKNAYTSVKNRSNSTTTFANGMTEEDRNKRIKEINSELYTLERKLSGYSRAKAYSTSKAMAEAEQKDRDRIAELKKEKTSLERTGTFTGKEMQNWEVEDAKKKVSNLQQKVASYGDRPSVDVAEEWGKANSELYQANQELKELKSQKELYKNIDKYGDVVNEDNFGGQWRANYRSTALSDKAGKAFSAYMNNPTEENRETAFAYQALVDEYLKNNEKALDDEGRVLSMLSKNFSSYLAQQAGTLKTSVPLGVVGAGIGLLGGGAGAKAGWTLGYSLGTGLSSYDTIRGSLFSELLSYGLDEETAIELANDDATIESLIESGETAKDWLFMLYAGGKSLLGKGGKAVTSQATNKLASAMAKASAHPLLNLGGNIAKGTVLNAGTEYLEEGTQGAVSRATREKAWAIIDSEIGQYGEGNIDLYNRPIYKNDDGTISTVDSVTYTVDGKYVVLPTIVRDENGNPKRLTTDDAIWNHYRKTGEYLGEFDTLEQANIYANRLHSAQAYRYSDSISTDADDSALVGGIKVAGDAIFGGNTEALGELHGQGMEGLKTGLITGGIHGGVRFAVSSFANAKSIKTQNEVADEVIKDEKLLDDLIELGKEQGEGTVSAEIATEIETSRANGKEVTREQVKKLLASNGVYQQAEDTNTEKTKTADSVEEKETASNPGISLYEAYRRGIVTPEILNLRSQNNEEITSEEVKQVTGFGEEGSRMVADYTNVEGKTFNQVLADVKAYYISGMENPNLSVEDMEQAFELPEQRNAYLAGQQDTKAQILADKARNVVIHKDAGFKTENFKANPLPSDVTQTHVKTMDLMAKALGVRSYMTEGLKGNAELDKATGEVPIDVSFQREADGVKVSIVFHAAHEMAVHRVVELAPEEGRAFVFAMYRHIAGKEPSVSTIADDKRMAYAEQGVEISLAKAMEEVSANNILRLYHNDEAKFYKAIEDIVNGKDTKAKQGLRKYIDYLNKMIRKILNFLSNKSAQEKSKYQAELDEITRLRDMFESAFRKAVENKRAIESKTDTNSTNNLEIKINEEYNGSKDHSLKEDFRTKIKYSPTGIKLPPNEYAKFRQSTSTDYYMSYKTHEGLQYQSCVTDDTHILYVYEDGGFDHYNVVARVDYKYDTVAKRIMEELDDGRYYKVTDLVNEMLEIPEVRQSGYSLYNAYTKKRSGSRGDGTLSKGQSKPHAGRVNESSRGTARDERGAGDDERLTEKKFSLKTSFPTEGMNDSEVENAQNVISALKTYAMSSKYVDGFATYTTERMEREIADSSSKTEMDYANSYITWVDPIDFIYATTSSEQSRTKLREEAGQLDIERLTKETQPIHLTVNFETGEIRGHEGRHRMLALQQAGIDKVAVVIDAVNNDRHNTKPIDMMRLKGQVFGDYQKGTDMFLHNMLPLSKRYADTARGLFTTKPKSGVQYSLKDSNGKSLTKAQQEYFKDSKVRDENGNLLVMYQGSANEFTIFDRKKSSYANMYGRGFYFTKSENHASQYGKTRAYYLNIKHPVSTTETTITKEQLHKFLQAVTENEDYSFENYGYGATVDSVLQSTYGKSDFLMLNDVSQTAIGDLVEAVELFNEINGTDYDGIVLDTETVTFNSEQAKLTTNENPTSNPDINFSLKQPVEETKNLIAVHNSTEEKLLGALKLGGLPSPSIAITKNDMSHENFGDISLVFRKDSISPTDRRNKIYSGDAYTPTGVRVEYDVDDDILQEFNKRLKELTPEWAKERLPSVDSGTAEAENDSLYRAYERNDRAKFAFLREKGKAPKIAMRTPRLSTFVSNDTVIALAKAFSAKQLSDIANTSEGVKQYKNAFLKVIRDNEDSRAVATGIYSADEASLYDIAETARVAKQVKENKYKIKKEIDLRNTFAFIDKKFTKALKEEYRAWIDENTKDAIIDKGIRNNRDLFTPSGKRRTFKQLHEPYNLSNIIKQMFSGEDKGIALFGGSPIGAAQHEYSSIADVKADSGRLQQLEQEEHDKMRDQIEADVFELARKMQIRSDVFAVRDLLSEAIGKKTKQQADLHLKRESHGWANYSPEFTNELWDIRERILNMPTGYFEAKPQRAVTFNEVALAVLPKGKTALRRMLEDAGVQKVVYYDKNKDGDRLTKINSVPDINFSLKNTDINTKDRKELIDVIEHLKGEFETTKLAKADPKKLAKMTRDILKDYSSKADYDETYKAIDELYQYMANGEEGNVSWDEVYSRAYEVARGIVENALVTDDYMYQQYKHLRDYLRTTPMKFTEFDSVPTAYENFNDFRKANIGRLKFANDGRSIDSVYQELADLYPEFFDAEEQTNSADQLEQIINVLDELQPTTINPFDRQITQASMQLANDITSRFFDVPQAKPTFADKAERRVVQEKIKGGKKVEKLREQNKDRIEKLIESQRAKTKKQLDKLRQQRDVKVEKEKAKRRDAISKMSENQKTKVLRARILRHTSDLNKKLVNPTDNQHIPYELQGAVAKLLECINLESNYTYDTESHSYKKSDEGLPTRRTQAFHELQKVYADIASSVVVDPDLLGEYGLLSDVIALADKRIADMNSSELDTVWQTIRAIEASISTANKVFSEGKFATILEVAETLREHNEGKASKTELKGVLGKGKKLATLDMLTPETYLHYLGNAGDSIFRMMRDAQDKHISIMKEVADFTHKELKDVDVNSLEKTMHTVKLGGEEVQLSTAQLMELYVLMKREQAVDHILVGGILPDVAKGKGLKLNTKAEPIRNLSKAEIGKALTMLTEEQKEVADKLQKYVSTVLSGYGNEASMQVYNYEKFTEENYWTIRTNKQEIQSDIGKDTAVTSVANKGMAKGTKPHANTSVRIGSIFDTFASHSSDMATYAAWLGTSEDVNRIRNFVFWENGVRTGTVKGILDTVHGIQGSKYLEKLLTDIAIGVKGTDNLNPFDKLVGHYKAASVGANIRVIIQQPTAMIRALDMIDAQYLAEGAVRPLKGWEKAKKYAPIAQWKDWGHFDINTGRQMKDVLFDNASLLEKTKQVGMWGASMADSLAWGQLWNAVEAETKAKHKGLEVNSEAFYETVAKRFTEIVDHTQVVDGILQRSQLMRSADNLTKMATSFMGEPTKQYNMAISAFNDAKTAKGDARKKAVARLGRTAMSLAVAGIVNACAQSIIDAMRDDDKEEKYWERWLTALIGDGEDEKWYDTNLADTVNPLNYVPFAKDIVSIFRGYDVKRMDTEAITKVFDASKNMYKAVTGTGKYTIAEASAQLFAEIARMFGVPVANVKRDVKSFVMAIAIETDSYLMQYRIEKAMLDINYAGNNKNFMDILFNAYNNDREAYEFIYEDMLESGYDADKIKSGMETRMKKAEGVKEASDLTKRYMTPADEKKYDSSLNKVKTSKVWEKANTTQRKNAEADLYEFLTSTTDDWAKTRAEASKYGVDETEYTLYQLAIEMADQPKGTKGSGSYDMTEKAEAINSLNLGDREIAYFFGKGLNEAGKEELNDVLKEGIDVQDYVNFKAATSEMKADKNANGKSITNSKKKKVVNYLNNANLSRDEWMYFYYEVMNYKK